MHMPTLMVKNESKAYIILYEFFNSMSTYVVWFIRVNNMCGAIKKE